MHTTSLVTTVREIAAQDLDRKAKVTLAALALMQSPDSANEGLNTLLATLSSNVASERMYEALGIIETCQRAIDAWRAASEPDATNQAQDTVRACFVYLARHIPGGLRVTLNGATVRNEDASKDARALRSIYAAVATQAPSHIPTEHRAALQALRDKRNKREGRAIAAPVVASEPAK